MSSQRLRFVDIINMSACQSCCPAQGCHKQTLVDVLELHATKAACFHLFSSPFIHSDAEKHVIQTKNLMIIRLSNSTLILKYKLSMNAS